MSKESEGREVQAELRCGETPPSNDICFISVSRTGWRVEIRMDPPDGVTKKGRPIFVRMSDKNALRFLANVAQAVEDLAEAQREYREGAT